MVSSLLYHKGFDYRIIFQYVVSDIFCLMKFAALTFNDLGIVPHKLKGYPIEYLISHRKGGPRFGSTVSEKVSPEDWP